MTAPVDVLVPTCGRPCALAVTLAGLASQTHRNFRVVVSDQSTQGESCASPEFQALARCLRAQDISVLTLPHLPRQGMAEQRAFLLAQAVAPYCLFLDDDVIVEPDLIARMLLALQEAGCGFVGSALHGLSYRGQRRPAHEHIEFWDTPVLPERVAPGGAAWMRHHLHSAANLFHAQAQLGLTKQRSRLYRVAWVGGCVMFDTEKLRACGGFDFWRELPIEHAGEDVLAQLRVMERFGGCAIAPSGAYHMELPTTLPKRTVDAPQVLWH